MNPWRLLTAELDGVAYQVLEYLNQLRFVSHHNREFIMNNNSVVLLDGHAEIEAYMTKDGIAISWGEGLASRAHPRIGKQVLNQPLHPVCPVYGIGHEFFGIGIELIFVAALHELGVARYHAQRLLQIMRGHIGKLL